MGIKGVRKNLLHSCKQIQIKDPLLKSLISGNLGKEKSTERYTGLLNSGHGENSHERQILSYLFRQAFKIVRLPGSYDIKYDSKIFSGIDPNELKGAIDDILKIYHHTQEQLRKYYPDTIKLVRGICGIEAEVASILLNEIKEDDIDFYFRTITFFNYKGGAYNRNFNVTFDCPTNWVWGCAYTVKELDRLGSDEEFITICKSETGVYKVPKKNIVETPSFHKITGEIQYHFSNPYNSPLGMHKVLSSLMQEGFEPDNFSSKSIRYSQGKWEEKLSHIGRYLDLKLPFSRKMRAYLK